MNRGPMPHTANSLAWFSIPSSLARSARRERRGLNPKLKGGIGGLLFNGVLGASLVGVVPAYADEEQLQRHIDAMKRQLEAMQRDLAQSRKQSAQQHVSAAPAQVVTARNGNEVIIPPASPPRPMRGSYGYALPIVTAKSCLSELHGVYTKLRVPEGLRDGPQANG